MGYVSVPDDVLYQLLVTPHLVNDVLPTEKKEININKEIKERKEESGLLTTIDL